MSPPTQQQQVLVVRGHPLDDPQQPGVVASVQAIGAEGAGLDAFYVPRVKVFVTAKTQEALVIRRHAGITDHGQILPGEDQAARCAMLQPTVANSTGEAEKRVASKRRRMTEHRHVRLTETAQIGADAFQVGMVAAGDDQPMGHFTHLELHLGELADLHGMVDEFVVVLGPVPAKAVGVYRLRLHRGRDSPVPAPRVRGPFQNDFDRFRFTALRAEEQAGTVEESAPGIQERAAHGTVQGEDLRSHRQFRAGIPATPRVLGDFFHVDAVAPGFGPNPDHVLCVLAQQVAARRP